MVHFPSTDERAVLVALACTSGSFGFAGALSLRTYHAANPATARTTTPSAIKMRRSGRSTRALRRRDPERTAHERVDPAEVRVRARAQVRRRLPRDLTRRGRATGSELAGVERRV